MKARGAAARSSTSDPMIVEFVRHRALCAPAYAASKAAIRFSFNPLLRLRLRPGTPPGHRDISGRDRHRPTNGPRRDRYGRQLPGCWRARPRHAGARNLRTLAGIGRNSIFPPRPRPARKFRSTGQPHISPVGRLLFRSRANGRAVASIFIRSRCSRRGPPRAFGPPLLRPVHRTCCEGDAGPTKPRVIPFSRQKNNRVIRQPMTAGTCNGGPPRFSSPID